MRNCLDSWAVLRWLEGEGPAAGAVEAVIGQRPVMSLVNVGEVYYVVWRSDGEATAAEVVDGLRARVQFDQPTEERVIAAARIKAEYPMAFADAFALATATAHAAVLLTGDPEILDAGGGWPLVDLRNPGRQGPGLTR